MRSETRRPHVGGKSLYRRTGQLGCTREVPEDERDAGGSSHSRVRREACSTIMVVDRRANHRCGSGCRGGILHFLTSAHPDRGAFCKRTRGGSSVNSRKVDCCASIRKSKSRP